LSVGVTLPKKVVEALEARPSLAEKYLEVAKERIAKADAIQASEGLYKVVEECVKVLVEILHVSEGVEAKSSAKSDAESFGEPKRVGAWAIAYDVHV